MLCDTCKIPMYITGSKHVVEGDNSSETPTKLFYVQTAKCSKCGKTEIIKNEIKLGE